MSDFHRIQNMTNELKLERDDIRLQKSEGGPVLRIGSTEILLRTFLYDGGDVFSDEVPLKTELDYDGDNGAWWNLVRDDEDDQPWVSIQPVVMTDNDGGAE